MKSRKVRVASFVILALIGSMSFARHNDATAPPVIELKAKRFSFTPGEITLKKGQPVVLRLSSEDVTHGLLLKELNIKSAIEPGKASDVAVTPQQTGDFVAKCDHYCGIGHPKMRLTIHVVE